MRTKPYDIDNILVSLMKEYKAGEKTLRECAVTLYEGGWTCSISEEQTKELLSDAESMVD